MERNMGLVIEAPLSIQLREFHVKDPMADELLINVRYVAICGSDVKLYSGTYSAPHQYPIIIGHEWVGIVVKTGSKAREHWKVGDIVTGDCSVFCGKCRNCSMNKNHCMSIEKKGITVDGCCARYIIANHMHLYRCPLKTDIRAFALSEPLAVAVNGISNRVPDEILRNSNKALVFGCGSIGILSVFTLLQYDIPDITVVDIEQTKLDIVTGFGFPNVRTMNTDVSDSDCPLADEYDLIVEAAGSIQTLKKSFEIANPCAHIVCLGHQKNVEFDFGTVVRKSLTIHASNGSSGGFHKAIEIIQRMNEQISELITSVIPLHRATSFFRNELAESKNIKTIIDLTGLEDAS